MYVGGGGGGGGGGRENWSALINTVDLTLGIGTEAPFV